MNHKKLSNTDLAEIALSYFQDGYSVQNLRHSEDLQHASPEQKDECCGYYEECAEMGVVAFGELYLIK